MNEPENVMDLGLFSISLAVKDISVSRGFYEKLGFSVAAGNQDQNWLVMRSGTTLVGLFQGMFEKNILTFNPGWDHNANTLPSFTDVRTIQAVLEERGVVLDKKIGENPSGRAHIMVTDPDGNPILIDQHV